ncbi:MAG: stage V sporulation protein AC [Oscillospiraceae bacterium]|nr:stage V sporulation protein AC [Oscillospiraceae bacterium]
MNISNREYSELTKKRSPNSKLYKTLPKAFLIGGTICALGEGLLNLYGYLGMDEKNAGALTSMTLIFLSALLTGLELYDRIAQHGGAGTLVPITGFANAVVSPAIDFKSEGYILGLGAKMFVIAGPVIVYGVTASVVYGFIYYFIGLFTGQGG